MKIEKRASPNHGSRGGRAINLLVLHADASPTADASLAWCCDPASKVSYHAIAGRSGRLFELVPDDRSAWHAGISEHPGSGVVGSRGPCVNAHSLGFCFSNKQNGVEFFTDAQLAAGALWVAAKMKAHPLVTLDRITTHEACARPRGRKHDPGPHFDVPDFLARVKSILR